MGVIVSDKSKADWLATNIYNLSTENIAKLVTASEENEWLYVDGDKYYGTLGRTVIGTVPSVDIINCVQDNNIYLLSADLRYQNKVPYATIKAEVEIKETDNIWYWILHKYTTDER